MCSALGHNHPRIVAAIQEACRKLIHASSSLLDVNEVRLAEPLASPVPEPLQKSFFLLSGSSVNETSLAVARMYTRRFDVASPHTSFHGLSESARAVTFTSSALQHGVIGGDFYELLAGCYLKIRRQQWLAGVGSTPLVYITPCESGTDDSLPL